MSTNRKVIAKIVGGVGRKGGPSRVSTNSEVPQWRESAYNAVRQGGHLTDDAWTNARIWRAVESALNDVAISIRRGPDYLKGTKSDPENALVTDERTE